MITTQKQPFPERTLKGMVYDVIVRPVSHDTRRLISGVTVRSEGTPLCFGLKSQTLDIRVNSLCPKWLLILYRVHKR